MINNEKKKNFCARAYEKKLFFQYSHQFDFELERIKQIQRDELQLMRTSVLRPELIDRVVEFSGNGNTSIDFLLMRWRPPMVLNRIVGIVVASAEMGKENESKHTGHKLILVFDNNASELLTVKAWDGAAVQTIARAMKNDRVEITRLSVTQKKEIAQNVTGENSFVYSLVFGPFSTIQILEKNGNWEGWARKGLRNAFFPVNWTHAPHIDHSSSSSSGTGAGAGQKLFIEGKKWRKCIHGKKNQKFF